MSKVTLSKLRRFVKLRAKSGFASNLQFQIDCNEAGMSVDDLGPVRKGEVGGIRAYLWTTPAGDLCEIGGRLLIVADQRGPVYFVPDPANKQDVDERSFPPAP